MSYFCDLKKLLKDKQSPNGRKFAQSGHPVPIPSHFENKSWRHEECLVSWLENFNWLTWWWIWLLKGVDESENFYMMPGWADWANEFSPKRRILTHWGNFYPIRRIFILLGEFSPIRRIFILLVEFSPIGRMFTLDSFFLITGAKLFWGTFLPGKSYVFI
jgi:hypothetical protein